MFKNERKERIYSGMTNAFMIYFVVILSILFLPERVWEFFWQKLSFRFERRNLFAKEKSAGEELLQAIPELEASLSVGMKMSGLKLPEYKFFTSLIYILLENNRRLGIGLKNVLGELKQNLILDLQFEGKLLDHTLGANAQFLVIALTTWFFIFFSSQLADLPLDSFILLLIILVQLSGIFVFNFLLKLIKKRTFNKFNQAISRLYLFGGLSEIGLSFGQVLEESKVMASENWSHRLFLPCARRLSGLVARWKETGLSPVSGSREIIGELWHLKEVSFVRFLKHLDLLKFVILAGFFLPAYFLYLYSIFQFFMEQ